MKFVHSDDLGNFKILDRIFGQNKMALASVSGYDRIMNGEKRRLHDGRNEITRIPRHLMQTSVADMPFELPAFADVRKILLKNLVIFIFSS